MEWSRLSPFGAVTGQAPSNALQSYTVLPAEQSQVTHPVAASATPNAEATVAASAAATGLGGPPPRSDQRYQQATTWRRVIPY